MNRRTDKIMTTGKGYTMTYKTLYRKIKIEEHEPLKNWGRNAVPVSHFVFVDIT